MNDPLVPDLRARPARPAASIGEQPRSVYIETYGCQMNVYDTQMILARLAEAGFGPVDDPLAADLIVVNTCSVREHAEHRVVSRLQELRRKRARAGLAPALLGVCGCMAERLQEELTRQELDVDLVVGVDRYDALPQLVEELLQPRAPAAAVAVGHDGSVHYVAPPEQQPANNSHLVTIHKGCDYRCTYCIVPYTRGPQSEKPPEVIIEEIRRITAHGGREVTLLGQNVTAYRWRGELDFAGLLDLVLRETDVERLRFLTGHPRDMLPPLMDLIGTRPRICPWLHVPAQSGSDRILRRMKRLYTSAQYLDMVAYARRAIPGATFSSDFIVGFPGETEADFEATLDLVRAVGFDSIFAFKYSPRPGVPAARLEDDVDRRTKERRLADLLDLQAVIWDDRAAGLIGEVWTAVVEAPARRPRGQWRLRTAGNRKIVAALPRGAPGQIRRVRIVGWKHTTFLGEAVDGEA